MDAAIIFETLVDLFDENGVSYNGEELFQQAIEIERSLEKIA